MTLKWKRANKPEKTSKRKWSDLIDLSNGYKHPSFPHSPFLILELELSYLVCWNMIFALFFNNFFLQIILELQRDFKQNNIHKLIAVL